MHKRREHLPSPVKQRILWSSPLKGMERPVRSFKSFIRTVPPNPGNESEKPLPPIPLSPINPNDVFIEPPSILLPEEDISSAAWHARTEWDWEMSLSHARPVDPRSSIPHRKYLPLLPEPSTGPFDPSGDIFPGTVEIGGFQRGTSDPECEWMEDRLEPPPRNPSRLSVHGRASGRSGSDSSTSSIPNDNQSSLSPRFLSETHLDQTTTSHLHSAMPTFVYPFYRTSDASTKAKEFASLGTGSPRNSRGVREDWMDRPDASQADVNATHLLPLRGKNLQPLVGSDISASRGTGVQGLNDKLEQLRFLQDYHHVLAHQYHDTYPQPAEVPIQPITRRITPRSNFGVWPQSPRKEQEMIPRPLAWRKSSESSSSSNYSRKKPTGAKLITTSRPNRMHQKMSSWVRFQHLYAGDKQRSTAEGAPPHSSKGAASSRPSLTGMAKDMSPQKSNRFPSLFAHAKGLRSHKIRSGSSRPTTVTQSSQQSVRPSTSLTPAQRSRSTTPLLRLPGGLALVRNSPSNTLRPNTPNISRPSPFVDTQLHKSHTGSPFPSSSGFRRPSSTYSQPSSTSPVSPRIAVNIRIRNSICSLPSPRPHSSSSSLPTSPLAQELFFPRTPPPPLPKNHQRTHRVSTTVSPISTDRGRQHLESFFDDELGENYPHRPGLLDKARDVRDAWKKHQKEAKHKKLKQSIRVLGPMDVVGTGRLGNNQFKSNMGSYLYLI